MYIYIYICIYIYIYLYTYILKALQEDPRLLAIEINRAEYELKKSEDEDAHRRKMEEAKLALEEKISVEKLRVELATAEAAKSASDATKEQTAMMAKIFAMLSKNNF
jgi:hypothetical protein